MCNWLEIVHVLVVLLNVSTKCQESSFEHYPIVPTVHHLKQDNGFLVSKETVMLCRWKGSKQKFGFIKLVDKG